MNRIAELRRQRGWSQEVLAEKIGRHKMTVHRLETGETDLTVSMMRTLAKVFGCSAADLLDFAALADAEDDVVPAEISGLGRMAAAMAKKGLKAYKVIGTSVTQIGIKVDDIIAVDTSPEAVAAPASGDILLVEMDANPKATVLRQFVAPNLLITNRVGNNLATSLDDASMRPRIVGVVLPE